MGSDDEILVFTVLKAFWSNPQTRSVVLKVRSLNQQPSTPIETLVRNAHSRAQFRHTKSLTPGLTSLPGDSNAHLNLRITALENYNL